MLKKILALTLGLVICLGATSLFGCKEASIFDGNYTEADEAAITTFSERVATEGEEQLDVTSGIIADVFIESVGSDRSVKLDADYKIVTIEEDVKMEGTLDMVMPQGASSVTINGQFWYADNYMYIDATSAMGDETESVKAKSPITLDNVLDMYGGGDYIMSTNLADLLPYAADENVKVYIDDGAEYKKVKAVIANMDMGYGLVSQTMSGEMVLVYNAEYKLVGISMNTVTTTTVENETTTNTVKISVQPYTGAVNLPADLTAFVEM